MKRLTQFQFQAFLHAPRPASYEYLIEEHEWYADDEERTLGVLFNDRIDDDWAYAILQQDSDSVFRHQINEHSFAEITDARKKLFASIEEFSSNLKEDKSTRRRSSPVKSPKPLDPFVPVTTQSKLNPLFKVIAEVDGYSPARGMVREVFASYTDRDGNFLEQFQTTGFDSRVWELYLHAYLLDSKFSIQPSISPDFLVHKGDGAIAIEAVTVHPTDGSEEPSASSLRLLTPPFDRHPLELDNAFEYKQEDFVPIKLGSALYSKLQKRYWESSNMQGIPIVLAIETFHQKESLFYSSSALGTYLYGFRHLPLWDTEGRLSVIPRKIDSHDFGGKSIPSGFFFQPEANHISAVLFSNSGTISKFNRMGQQGPYHNPRLVLHRVGYCSIPDPNAVVPGMFSYTVGDSDFEEWWGHGLEMFHNPNALYPVNPDLFPEITHHRFEGGLMYTDGPPFYPYSSVTLSIAAVDNP